MFKIKQICKNGLETCSDLLFLGKRNFKKMITSNKNPVFSRKEDSFKYEIHKEILDRMLYESSILQNSFQNLKQLRQTISNPNLLMLLDDWEKILGTNSYKKIRKVSLGTSSYCIDMRQNSPLVLTS